MSARDEVAAVLLECRAEEYFGTGWRDRSTPGRLTYLSEGSDWHEEALRTADALLASPALARVIREAEAEAEAWDEGRRTGSSRAMRKMSDEPSLPLASERDNPYRDTYTEEH